MHCFSIISSTFVVGFRIRVIPKDIVDKRNGVRYLIQRPRNVGSFKEYSQRIDKVSVHVIAWAKLI